LSAPLFDVRAAGGEHLHPVIAELRHIYDRASVDDDTARVPELPVPGAIPTGMCQ
jgi:hypothetical protein